MIITFNTDHHKDGNADFRARYQTILTEKLENYSHEIKKLDVHLTDENGKKEGGEDKKCLLEAHIEKMNPIVSTNHAGTYELSLTGAIDNLKAALDKQMGKLNDRHNA